MIGSGCPRRVAGIVLSLVSEPDSPRTGFTRSGQQSMERLQLDLRTEAGRVAHP
jgi:hypothetical protein